MPGLRPAVPIALALTLGALPLRADISAPDGRRWIREYGTTIVNLDEFPSYVLVAWPCRAAVDVSLDPYCVAKPGESLQAEALYALAKRDVELGEIGERNGVKLAAPVLAILKPHIDNERKFFRNDPRVIRPFFLRHNLFGSSSRQTGVVGAWYFARIESIDAKTGVRAKFVRAKYECRTGAQVEVDWGPNQEEPPVPLCPVTDDQGMLIPVSTGTTRGEGTLTPVRPPPTRARTIWLGVMIASLGLIGVGALWKKKRV